MDEQSLQRLRTVVTDAASTLFEVHGVKLPPCEPEDALSGEDHDIAATIGFGSPMVRGAILVTTRKALVARAWPRELARRDPTNADVCDWAGELTNQLLGRIKNALPQLGAHVVQGTPTVIEGRTLHRAALSSNSTLRCIFITLIGSLAVHLDVEAAADLELLEEPPTTTDSLREGELRLF